MAKEIIITLTVVQTKSIDLKLNLNEFFNNEPTQQEIVDFYNRVQNSPEDWLEDKTNIDSSYTETKVKDMKITESK